MKEDFFTSKHCLSGVHCNICRDTEKGKAFRSSIAKSYSLPVIDFDCPKNIPWNNKEPIKESDIVFAKRSCSRCSRAKRNQQQ